MTLENIKNCLDYWLQRQKIHGAVGAFRWSAYLNWKREIVPAQYAHRGDTIARSAAAARKKRRRSRVKNNRTVTNDLPVIDPSLDEPSIPLDHPMLNHQSNSTLSCSNVAPEHSDPHQHPESSRAEPNLSTPGTNSLRPDPNSFGPDPTSCGPDPTSFGPDPNILGPGQYINPNINPPGLTITMRGPAQFEQTSIQSEEGSGDNNRDEDVPHISPMEGWSLVHGILIPTGWTIVDEQVMEKLHAKGYPQPEPVNGPNDGPPKYCMRVECLASLKESEDDRDRPIPMPLKKKTTTPGSHKRRIRHIDLTVEEAMEFTGDRTLAGTRRSRPTITSGRVTTRASGRTTRKK